MGVLAGRVVVTLLVVVASLVVEPASAAAGKAGDDRAASTSRPDQVTAADLAADRRLAQRWAPTTAAPARVAITTPTAPAPSAAAPIDPLERIHAIADGTGLDWRRLGGRFTIGCHPRGRCAWGVFDPATRTIWIGPNIVDDESRLRYAVLHELAHLWQHTHDLPARIEDLAAWGQVGAGGLERAADCLAAHWGATIGHYWTCPPAARAHLAEVYARTR
jgi:hypothetical protein